MRKLNFAEERGSGIDKSVSACEFFGLPPLTFINTADYFRAILYTPRSFSEMSKEERVNAVFQHSCLNYVTSKQTQLFERDSDSQLSKIRKFIDS